MDEETENKIREHLRACITKIGYDAGEESLLSKTMLLRDHIVGDIHNDKFIKEWEESR